MSGKLHLRHSFVQWGLWFVRNPWYCNFCKRGENALILQQAAGRPTLIPSCYMLHSNATKELILEWNEMGKEWMKREYKNRGAYGWWWWEEKANVMGLNGRRWRIKKTKCTAAIQSALQRSSCLSATLRHPNVLLCSAHVSHNFYFLVSVH